jgi:hypothetical protein
MPVAHVADDMVVGGYYELLVWESTLPLDLGATLKSHKKRR